MLAWRGGGGRGGGGEGEVGTTIAVGVKPRGKETRQAPSTMAIAPRLGRVMGIGPFHLFLRRECVPTCGVGGFAARCTARSASSASDLNVPLCLRGGFKVSRCWYAHKPRLGLVRCTLRQTLQEVHEQRQLLVPMAGSG
jgi:hypothetical protein